MKNINKKQYQQFLAMQSALNKKPKSKKRKSKKKAKKSDSTAGDFIGLCLIAGILFIGFKMLVVT